MKFADYFVTESKKSKVSFVIAIKILKNSSCKRIKIITKDTLATHYHKVALKAHKLIS